MKNGVTYAINDTDIRSRKSNRQVTPTLFLKVPKGKTARRILKLLEEGYPTYKVTIEGVHP